MHVREDIEIVHPQASYNDGHAQEYLHKLNHNVINIVHFWLHHSAHWAEKYMYAHAGCCAHGVGCQGWL